MNDVLFIYQRGDAVHACDMKGAEDLQKNPMGWRHVMTVDPAIVLKNLLERNPDLIELIEPDTCPLK